MSAPYHVKVSPAAVKSIKKLAAKQQRGVIQLMESLAVNPRPSGANRVAGMRGLYTEMANEFRVVYKIDNQDVLLLVVKSKKISHHKGALPHASENHSVIASE